MFKHFIKNVYQVVLTTLVKLKLVQRRIFVIMDRISCIVVFISFLTADLGVAQTTMTVEQFGTNMYNSYTIPDELTHIKDVNQVLQPFVGSWQAAHNGDQVEVFITFVTYNGVVYLEKDILILDYKITNAAGLVLIDTRISPWTGNTALGWFLSPSGTYQMVFKKLKEYCELDYNWNIRLGSRYTNTNQISVPDILEVVLIPQNEIYHISECPNGIIESLFPVTDDFIRFTRM